ncbi:ASPH [Symbiodinium natans]|uniref:ASPH protein n=1 Tax=Symbiodinium natans TaxID=878477 RepID=A0A812IKM0_9DINO|nr:ASPH [Symbiodinium natans]
MEDHDVTRPVAPWFSVVFGFDEEDGWVKLEDGSYLPSFVNDVPVLTVPQDDEGGQ